MRRFVYICVFLVVGVAKAQERELPPILPPPTIEPELKKLVRKKLFSLSLRDADVVDVLLMIAKGAKMNLVLEEAITGLVTVDLKDIDLETALTSILKPLGYWWVIEDRTIKVARMQERIFRIHYPQVARTGTSSVNISISSGRGGVGVGGAGGAGGVGAGMAGGVGAVGVGFSTSTLTTHEDVDFWTSLEDVLNKLKSPQGLVVVDRISGTIWVKDIPESISAMERLIEEVKGQILKQVMIEARILEVGLRGGFESGIDWSLFPKAIGVKWVGTAQRTFVERGGSSILRFDTGGFPAGREGPTLIFGVTDDIRFDLLLQFLSSFGKVDTISSPRISTLNNQPAIIRIGTDLTYFLTRVQTTVGAGGQVVTTETAVPSVVNIGVLLDITPQIEDEHIVNLKIVPVLTRLEGEARSRFGDTAPIISIRQASTLVRVKDGGTVIIGGLMKDEKREEIRKVPILGDIPILGFLFRNTYQKKEKTEVVILLTPYVITPEEADIHATEAETKVKEEMGGFHEGPLYFE